MSSKQEFLRGDLAVAIATEKKSDGSIVVSAWPVDLPGCIASGTSTSQAIQKLKALLPAYLDSLEAIGREIPAPQLPAVIPGVIQFYDSATGICLSRPDMPQGPTLHETPDFQLESVG